MKEKINLDWLIKTMENVYKQFGNPTVKFTEKQKEEIDRISDWAEDIK